MSYKHMPRLGSAIASTILSLFSAVLLVGVDKAQAVRLTYTIDDSDFKVDTSSLIDNSGLSFFKVDTSSLTGIGVEEVPVLDGRFYGYTLRGGKEFYDLVGAARVLFFQGEFRGLQAGGSDQVIRLFDGNFKIDSRVYWSIYIYPRPNTLESLLDGYFEEYRGYGDRLFRYQPRIQSGIPVSYTLVNTEPEPVPEPLTAGGTALALAGLSWLKQKKKMAA